MKKQVHKLTPFTAIVLIKAHRQKALNLGGKRAVPLSYSYSFTRNPCDYPVSHLFKAAFSHQNFVSALTPEGIRMKYPSS